MSGSGWLPRWRWGVVKVGTGLLGERWGGPALIEALAKVHPHGPTRPLLFVTRRHARAWCAAQHAKYAAYPEGHICRAWRFRPVRVRESWTLAAQRARQREEQETP